MPASASPANSAKDVALSFVAAINEEDFAAARSLADDDLSFVGVLGSRQGADAYFNDMTKMRLKYDVKKAFADGDDVCLLYDLTISDLTIFGCGWYRVEGGKVKSLQVIFDPRRLLEASR
jgi:ketosteroid isomerase-like protein